MGFLKVFVPQFLTDLSQEPKPYLLGAFTQPLTENNSILIIDTCTREELLNFASQDTLKVVGYIKNVENRTKDHEENYIIECSNSPNGLSLQKINLPKLTSSVAIFYYSRNAIQNLAINVNTLEEQSSNGDIIEIVKCVNCWHKCKIPTATRNGVTIISKQTILNVVSFMPKIISSNTALSNHIYLWSKCMDTYTFHNGKIWTIFLDVLLGLVSLILLLYVGKVSEHLFYFTQLIVEQLRYLLVSLEGNPVGLKLNVQLNNFLLNSFSYHVDLWATFLNIISPGIQFFYIPFALIGWLGLSFQLAMISDLLVLVTLHAHCFYIYAAALYHVELVGLRALWRVVIGKRRNILKNRIESYDYINRQLYLATLFFASLLFLLPTIIVYYVVFALLRLFVFSITHLLYKIQRLILTFPIYNILKWMTGSFLNLNSVQLKFMKSPKGMLSNLEQTIVNHFEVDIKQSQSLKDCFTLESTDEDRQCIGIKEFVQRLIKGEMMGFVQPKKL